MSETDSTVTELSLAPSRFWLLPTGHTPAPGGKLFLTPRGFNSGCGSATRCGSLRLGVVDQPCRLGAATTFSLAWVLRCNQTLNGGFPKERSHELGPGQAKSGFPINPDRWAAWPLERGAGGLCMSVGQPLTAIDCKSEKA